MFYRIVREFDDGCLYYCGGAPGESSSWTEGSSAARHYRSAVWAVELGEDVATSVEGGRVGVEEVERLPSAAVLYEEDSTRALHG